jgi:hypothetical protein
VESESSLNIFQIVIGSSTWKLRHQTVCNCRQTTDIGRLDVWIVSKSGHDTKLTWILKNEAQRYAWMMYLDSWDDFEYQLWSSGASGPLLNSGGQSEWTMTVKLFHQSPLRACN